MPSEVITIDYEHFLKLKVIAEKIGFDPKKYKRWRSETIKYMIDKFFKVIVGEGVEYGVSRDNKKN